MINFFKKLIPVLMICMLISCSQDEENISWQQTKLTVFSPKGDVVAKYEAQIADTLPKIRLGLMHRPQIAENFAMLFDMKVLPKQHKVAFWMKNTLIPLDMLFADDNGIIFYIYENAKPLDTTPIYPPQRPAQVVEINGGQAARLGIKTGYIIKKL